MTYYKKEKLYWNKAHFKSKPKWLYGIQYFYVPQYKKYWIKAPISRYARNLSHAQNIIKKYHREQINKKFDTYSYTRKQSHKFWKEKQQFKKRHPSAWKKYVKKRRSYY